LIGKDDGLQLLNNWLNHTVKIVLQARRRQGYRVRLHLLPVGTGHFGSLFHLLSSDGNKLIAGHRHQYQSAPRKKNAKAGKRMAISSAHTPKNSEFA